MKAVALFYNKEAFPTAPATTDDWKTNASKLGRVYGANGGGAYYPWGLYRAFGGKILDDDGKCAADRDHRRRRLPKVPARTSRPRAATSTRTTTTPRPTCSSGKIGGFIDGPWQSGDL